MFLLSNLFGDFKHLIMSVLSVNLVIMFGHEGDIHKLKLLYVHLYR